MLLWLVLVVLWMTWTPLQLSDRPNRLQLFPVTTPLELIGNTLLLVPLGIVLGLVFRRGYVASAVGAAVLSSIIELGQVFLVGRIVSLTDLLLNTAGAAAAGWLAMQLQARLGKGRIIGVTGGGVFALLMLFTIEGGLILNRGIRIADWDPSFPIVVADEADGTKPYVGTVNEARICAGRGWEQICASADAPAEVRQRLVTLAEESQRVDLYARFVSATDQQWGPSRIVTFSSSQFRRNITLGQEGTALVLRLRTPLMGSNGRQFELWLPRAVHAGEPLQIHTRFDGGAVVTEMRSDKRLLVKRYTFDALSSGLIIRGAGEITPLQIGSTRAMSALILIIPVALVLLSTVTRPWRYGTMRW